MRYSNFPLGSDQSMPKRASRAELYKPSSLTLKDTHSDPGKVSQRAGGNGLNALGQLRAVSGAEWLNQSSPLNSLGCPKKRQVVPFAERGQAQVKERQ